MKVAPPSLVAFFVSHNRPAKIVAGANCIREKHSCPRVLFKPIRALVILHSPLGPRPQFIRYKSRETRPGRGNSVRKALFLLPAFRYIFLFTSRPAFSQISNASATILVDDDKVQCPTAQFTTIQSAVNAATSGDVIRVCAGTYPEQVTISTSLTLRADNGVVVIPSGMTQNSTGASGGDSIAAVFVVQGAQDVVLDGFIVDGSNNGITGCSPRLIGIDYENSSGHVRHNSVRHMSPRFGGSAVARAATASKLRPPVVSRQT